MTDAAGHPATAHSTVSGAESPAVSAFRAETGDILNERESHYPMSAAYFRAAAVRDLRRALKDAEEGVASVAAQSDLYWQNMEEVLGDITAIVGISAEELPLTGVFFPRSDGWDFDSLHEEIYEQTIYPAMEHLNYIDFEPALHRARFVIAQLAKLDAERGRFLDAGCGPGVLLSLILQAKAEWIGQGIDISASCCDYARKLVQRKGVDDRARLDVGDIRDLPYDDEEFDLVVAVEVLAHVRDSEVGMRELLRVLEPGGRCILALPVNLQAHVHLRDFSDVSEVLTFYEQFDMDILRFECEEFMLRGNPYIDTFALMRKPL